MIPDSRTTVWGRGGPIILREDYFKPRIYTKPNYYSSVKLEQKIFKQSRSHKMYFPCTLFKEAIGKWCSAGNKISKNTEREHERESCGI